jgi:hypothetical protein
MSVEVCIFLEVDLTVAVTRRVRAYTKFVLGRSSNGRLDWKDAQGRTLKVLQGEGSV